MLPKGSIDILGYVEAVYFASLKMLNENDKSPLRKRFFKPFFLGSEFQETIGMRNVELFALLIVRGLTNHAC